MANRFKEQTGWCSECNARRLVRRKDALFQGWRCTVCGAVTREVGEGAVSEARILATRSTYAVQGAPTETVGMRVGNVLHVALVGIVVSVLVLVVIAVVLAVFL